MSNVNWNDVRQEFPALAHHTFLNTATYGQLPVRSRDAMLGHLQRRDDKACGDFLEWFDDLAELRGSIARLINAQEEDFAFITAASQGLGLVMSGFDWQEGDEVLTLENEFPNQLYAAQAEVGVRGVECRWDEFEASVTPRTRLALLSTVNYVTGLRPDLSRIVAQLKSLGVVVYLDGTQSVGALQFDCAAVQPDFLAVDAYKWMISPNGAGFIYVSPNVRQWLRPNVIGWRSDRDWRNVDNLHHGAPRFADTAEKYEGGMVAFPSLYGMKAALELTEALGKATVEARVLELAAAVRRELLALGAEEYPLAGDRLPSQIILARLPGLDSSLVAKQLAMEKIMISARKGYLRISPHFYNNENDISALIEALRKHSLVKPSRQLA